MEYPHREPPGSRSRTGCRIGRFYQVAYGKHLESEIARKYEHDHPSEYFGTIGKREVFTLTVVGRREIESDWGGTTLVMFRDAAGNKAKWFASEAGEFQLDRTLTVKATVKAHDEYKGSRQTELSRAAVWDEAFKIASKAAAKAAKKLAAKRYACNHEPKDASHDVSDADMNLLAPDGPNPMAW